MATKIQLRRDTAADWTSANPTLAAGEFGYESDTTKFKIGDGSTAWNSLAYISQGTITALNNQAENRLVSLGSTTTELDGEANLTFDGSTLTLTGSAALDGVTIADNTITTNRSNDNLEISANGTGQVELGAPFDQINTNTRYDYGVNMAYVNNSYAGNTRTWVNNQGHKHTLTQAGGSNFEINSENRAALEMAGFDATSGTRFFTSKQYNMLVSNNSSATAATLNNARSLYSGITASTSNGNLTLSDARGNHSYIAGEPATGKTATITNSYNYYAQPLFDFGEGGTTSGTNAYGFYFASGSLATNTYAFYDASNSLSVFGDIQTQGVSITDNHITTNRSNDDLNLEANGTGQIQIKGNGGDFSNFGTSNRYDSANLMYYEDLSDTVGDGQRHYTNTILQNIRLTSGQNSSNSNDRWRNLAMTKLDLNGSSTTATSSIYRSRGPMGLEGLAIIDNSSATDATLGNASGGNYGVSIYPSSTGEITITSTTGMGSYLDVGIGSDPITITDHVGFKSIGIEHYDNNGTTGALTITDYYGFYAGGHNNFASTASLNLTNNYGFYFDTDTQATNQYAFYDASNSLSVFGDIQTQAVSITDNHITTNRSNDHLHISANGTGKVNISNSDAVPEDNLVYSNGFGTIDRNRGVRLWESISAQGEMTSSGDRDYGHLMAKEWRLTSGLTSSDSDNRYRAFQSVSAIDLNGAAMTSTSSYSGPQGGNGNTYLDNSNASAATMSNSTGFYASVYVYPTVGAITATNTYGVRSEIDFDGSSASVSGTNGYLFQAAMYSDGGTTSLTNGYGVYISDLSLATNKYAFWDNTNSLSRFGAVILANQASDPSTVTDSAHIYAKDVSASSEVFVRDEAGNVTQISPHNEAGEWQYWSENVKTGKKVRVNMERMIRRLEEITGEKFIENE